MRIAQLLNTVAARAIFKISRIQIVEPSGRSPARAKLKHSPNSCGFFAASQRCNFLDPGFNGELKANQMPCSVLHES